MKINFLDQSIMDHHTANAGSFSGAILGLQGDVLHGWAKAEGEPEQNVVVEVLIDGVSVALARADQYEPDACTNGQFHGFLVQLRQSWLNNARAITARIANQLIELEGRILLPTTVGHDSAQIASQIWYTGGLRIGGWCWDPQAPNRHVKITVREGNRVIVQATCNTHNQALAYRTTSDHGISIDLPWELADGQMHTLDLVDDRGQELAGSPIQLCCQLEGIEGLIRKYSKNNEPATLELLSQLANAQTSYLPASAGWAYYPEWFKAFQHVEFSEAPSFKGKLGILLISDRNSELEDISLASFNTENGNHHKFAKATIADLSSALRSLLLAGCDRILPIHAGDRLAPHALPYISALLDDGKAWGFADCDHDDAQGGRSSPWFKPVWDIDLFIGLDLFTPGAIFGCDIIEKALKLIAKRSDKKGLSWHDLVAGIALATHRDQASVAHLPRILYHRTYDKSEFLTDETVLDQRLDSIQWLCNELDSGSAVDRIPGYPSLLRAKWSLPLTLPKVSLIVPTRNQYSLLKTCIEGLLNKTDYPNLEVIIVDNQSSDLETLEYLNNLEKLDVKILKHPYPFNYSAINNRAVSLASGEIIGLINNDIEIIEDNWLKEMVAQLLRPGIGVVGAKLLWPNKMVQHGGVVVGINGLAAHCGNDLHEQDAGYLAINQLTRRQSAVTAACLIMKKETFKKVNGLDEVYFPVAFNDVDLCLKVAGQGLDVLWCASAQLVHAESASRGKDQTPEKFARAAREQKMFKNKWAQHKPTDPYYHPALSHDYLSSPYGGLRIPPCNLMPRWK